MKTIVSRRSLLVLSFATLALMGCAHKETDRVQRPPIRQIQLVPVAPVDRLYTENKGLPVGILWQGLADRIKSKEFDERMSAARKAMATRMTDALRKSLAAQGYEVQVLDGIARPASSPDDINYLALPGAEPVLHVYFTDVGMYSPRFSPDYIPRVNVTANLLRPNPKTEDYAYSENIRYGADSSGDKSWSIPAADKFKWPNFGALTEHPDEVEASYSAAVDALAEKIALNIRTQAK